MLHCLIEWNVAIAIIWISAVLPDTPVVLVNPKPSWQICLFAFPWNVLSLFYLLQIKADRSFSCQPKMVMGTRWKIQLLKCIFNSFWVPQSRLSHRQAVGLTKSLRDFTFPLANLSKCPVVISLLECPEWACLREVRLWAVRASRQHRRSPFYLFFLTLKIHMSHVLQERY